jgi:hypothetical protein
MLLEEPHPSLQEYTTSVGEIRQNENVSDSKKKKKKKKQYRFRKY